MSNTKSLVVLEHPTRPIRQKHNLRIFLATLALSGLAGSLVLTITPARRALPGGAPTIGIPSINVGPVMVAEPWTETQLPIHVGPAQLIPRGGWIRIGGLPLLSSLSDGYAIAPGSWSVPTGGLSTLKITAPTSEGMRSEIKIALMSSDGRVLTEARSVLVVIPTWLVGSGQKTPATPSPEKGALSIAEGTIAAPPALRPAAGEKPAAALSKHEARRRAQNLLRKGDDSLSEGNVGVAREFYERAAKMGWAPAAVALAATFDPNELVQRQITAGVVAEPEAARLWYARARELANAEADFYLQRLEQDRTRWNR